MQFKISSDLEKIYELEERVLEEIRKAGYDGNSRFAIRLALDEALINAHNHGNHAQPDKSILLDVKVDPEEVEISVEDEGEGFDQSILLDPRRGDQLKRTSGRGVFLIRQFMSTARFNEKGSRITFTYHKKNHFEQEEKSLAHWKFESATVLEINPAVVEEDPGIIYRSVVRLLDSGTDRILLDLKFLDRIDSSILGFLVRATRETESRGGSLVLVRPQPIIDRVIRATSLDAVLKVFGDLRKGLDAAEQTRIEKPSITN